MRKLLLALLVATPLAAQLERPVVVKVAGMDAIEVRKNVAYDGERKLDLYRPKNATGALPLIVFINGVGRPDLKEWGQYTSWPRLAATRGLAAISYETSGESSAAQTDALLRYVNEHAKELTIDPKRIAIWACSANGRVGTALLAAREDLRAAVFYYALMETAPKNILTPVYVARAGLDAPSLNTSIDRWVAGAVSAEAPVTLVTYPEGVHGFDLEQDTPESRQIVTQTLDFLQFHLMNERTPRKEPMTLAQLQALVTGKGIEQTITRLKELRGTHPDAYVLQERSLNTLGYSLLGDRKPAEAVLILELVATMYPESANAHDSLGDAYEAAGRAADAIRESRRALELLDRVPQQQRDAIRRSAEGKLARLKGV